MNCLHVNECAEWCVERGGVVDGPFALAADPGLPARAVIEFAPTGSTGLESQVVEACLQALGDWDECLLWVTEWGVWPSSEDWPAYYALRGAAEERASLAEKPGHLFGPTQHKQFRQLLLMVLAHGWEAELLPSSAGGIPCRVHVSHDGWVELCSKTAQIFQLGAV